MEGKEEKVEKDGIIKEEWLGDSQNVSYKVNVTEI